MSHVLLEPTPAFLMTHTRIAVIIYDGMINAFDKAISHLGKE